MSVLGIRWSYETMRTVSAATITAGAAAYVNVGTPLDNPCSQIYLINFTDVTLVVSFDGGRDAFIMPAASNHFNDIGSDKTNQAGALLCHAGTQIQVKYLGGANPTTGNFYATVFYGAPAV